MLDGRSESVVVIFSIFLATSLVTVLLRCYVRIKIVRAFGWDDWVMVFAMALNVVFATCGIVGANYGIGKKTIYFETHSDDYLHRALLCWWLIQVFYILTCIAAKLSIILTILRVVVDRIHSWILYAAMTIAFIVGMLLFFFFIFECHPVNSFWTRPFDKPEFDKFDFCIDFDIVLAVVYVYSVGAAITDFTIALLPVFLIWNLRMNLRMKVVTACILGIGCIASSAVIVRIPYLPGYKGPEFLYATTNLLIWSIIEAGLSITAGSLTTLRPLIRLFNENSSTPRSPEPDSFSLSLPSMTDNNNDTLQLRPGSVDNDDNCHGWGR